MLVFMSQLEFFGSADKPMPPASPAAAPTPKPSEAEFRRSVEYQKHINSAQWKNTRQVLFKMRGRKCEKCDATTDLEVHHLTYERFGHESEKDLQILCPPHHEEADRVREAEQQRAFEERCDTTRDTNARDTYFTKKYGEGYYADESMHREFDEWKEKKRENDYWGGGDSEY
jgi:hypothetical protein